MLYAKSRPPLQNLLSILIALSMTSQVRYGIIVVVGIGVVVVAGKQVSIGGSPGPLRPKHVLLLESSRVQARLLALNTQ